MYNVALITHEVAATENDVWIKTTRLKELQSPHYIRKPSML